MHLDAPQRLRLLQPDRWTVLRTLHLTYCHLTRGSIAQLVSMSLHQLEELNLIGSQLTAAACEELSKADWPELTSLIIESIDFETDAALSAERQAGSLSAGNSSAVWPKLAFLAVRAFGRHDDNMSWLTRSHFPNLQSVNASGDPDDFFSAENLQKLTYAQWPLLNKLDLGNIGACANGLCHLSSRRAEACWPMLKSLDLSERDSFGDSYFDEVCAILAHAMWPLLEKLSLRGQPVYMEGATELVKANWPMLKFLYVCSDTVGPAVLRVLMTRNWLHLEHLEVQDSIAVAAELSNGDGSELSVVRNEIAAPGDIAGGCWPSLKVLVMGSPNTESYDIRNIL